MDTKRHGAFVTQAAKSSVSFGGQFDSAGPVLETPRLLLRQLRIGDLDAMRSYLGDPKTMLHYPAPFSREFVQEGIRKNLARYEEYGYGLLGVVLKQSGQLIGDCGLVWQDLDTGAELEVGYHFRRDHWNHGYATEAARACIEFAFEHTNVDHVISLIRPENLASSRVAEKNGLRISRQITWNGLLHEVWKIDSSDHKVHKGIKSD
jgi:ribosomal-protein-alanine N-acetyltransferase